MRRLSQLLIWLFALILAQHAHAQAAPPRVAVMPFDNASDDATLAPLGVGLQAMLTTDLSATGALQLVERARLGEIQAELALGQSSAIDPATAAKIGKLSGATHLLAGAFTVVGKTMRLDARLIAIDSGNVIVTANHAGEKDAFFELQKSLVNDIIRALNIALPARERASVARIHTADFSAFESYAKGIAEFDQKHYAASLEALRNASTQDPEFKLARITLDQYDALIAKLQARVPQLRAELPNLYHERVAAAAIEHREILETLMRGAQGTGIERLASLYQLAIYQGPFYLPNQHFNEVRAVEDRFVLDRLSETYCMAYWVAAQEVWPKVPLFITNQYAGVVPHTLATYEAAETAWIREFLREDTARIADELRPPAASTFGRRMRLDNVASARLLGRAYPLIAALGPDYRERVGRSIGSYLRSAGLIDDSSAIFADLGKESRQPGVVRDAQEQLAINRLYLELLQRHKSPRLREWQLIKGFPLRTNLTREYLEDEAREVLAEPPSAKVLETLNKGRSFNHFAIIAGEPMWALGDAEFAAGPMTALIASTRFNYFQAKDDLTVSLAIAGAKRGADLSASFELDYTPTNDWWHREATPETRSAIPETTFLFGAQDLDVAYNKIRLDLHMQRGVRGFGLVITKNRASIVEINEVEAMRVNVHQRYQLLYRELAHISLGTSKRRAIRLTIKGQSVSASIGGKSLTTTLPEAPFGYAGFGMRNAGYVSVDGMKLAFAPATK